MIVFQPRFELARRPGIASLFFLSSGPSKRGLNDTAARQAAQGSETEEYVLFTCLGNLCRGYPMTRKKNGTQPPARTS